MAINDNRSRVERQPLPSGKSLLAAFVKPSLDTLALIHGEMALKRIYSQSGKSDGTIAGEPQLNWPITNVKKKRLSPFGNCISGLQTLQTCFFPWHCDVQVYPRQNLIRSALLSESLNKRRREEKLKSSIFEALSSIMSAKAIGCADCSCESLTSYISFSACQINSIATLSTHPPQTHARTHTHAHAHTPPTQRLFAES